MDVSRQRIIPVSPVTLNSPGEQHPRIPEISGQSQSQPLPAKTLEAASTGSEDADEDDDEDEDEDGDEDEDEEIDISKNATNFGPTIDLDQTTRPQEEEEEEGVIWVSTKKGVRDRLQARTPEYDHLVDRMRIYVSQTNLALSPHKYEELESAWILFTMPAAILRNSQHILHVRNRLDGTLYVICYTARLFRVKRMHGRLKKILQPLGYKMHKLISTSPEVEDFYNYVPAWVDTKAYRESFASQFGVFIRRPESGLDYYLKLANSMKVFKTSEKPIDFVPLQPIRDERPKRAFDIVQRYFDLTTLTPQAGAKCPEPLCPFVSGSKDDLVDHINLEHIKYPGFKCPTCNKTFLSKRLLATHSLNHGDKRLLKPKSSKELMVDEPLHFDSETPKKEDPPVNLSNPAAGAAAPATSAAAALALRLPSISPSRFVVPPASTSFPPAMGTLIPVPFLEPQPQPPASQQPPQPQQQQVKAGPHLASMWPPFIPMTSFPYPFHSAPPPHPTPPAPSFFLQHPDPVVSYFPPPSPLSSAFPPSAPQPLNPQPKIPPPALSFHSYVPPAPSQTFHLNKNGPNIMAEAPSPPETQRKRSGGGIETAGEQGSSLKRLKEIHLGTPWSAETIDAQYELMRSYFDLVPIPPSGLKCPESNCPFTSSSRYALATHANEAHIRLENFACPQCSEKFTSFELANRHLEEQHPQPQGQGARSSGCQMVVSSESNKLPFLTVKHGSGETDLFLIGGHVVSQPRSQPH